LKKGVIEKRMAEICEVCGLPKDICVCGEISKDQQRIRVRLEKRKWNKPVTVIEGIDEKSVDLGRLAAQLKTYCACGGTAKNSQIMLQGDHRDKTRYKLIQLGFPEENIEIT
jgi:translation initiation factor 1